MEALADNLRSADSELDLHEALTSPVAVLLGVTDAAGTALEAIGIKTVFDLGTSSVFAQADSAIRADWLPIGRIPSDVVDDDRVPTSVEEASSLPLEALRAIPDDAAAALKSALGVETVRDFARWPPRTTAAELVRKAVGGEAPMELDAFAERLRPAMGEYPTERVYYDTLLMLGTTGGENLEALEGAISLSSEADATVLDKPAVGALVTLSQSWFVQGVTLGHMLHSLALAPGEATRVAVVDWSRRTSAATSETIAETEQLDNAATHSRAISEVQNAVANEMQRGSSMSSGWAESESGSWNESSSMGLGLAGMFEGVTGALGFSQGGSSGGQWAESSYGARSASWSVGERSTSASMAQNVNDRTEQHSSSVRNRRATAVREVSQSEHEQISTRVVANYNHMHALTVQYYEVVQLYRVVVRTHAVGRVLFLPFELIDFSAANALDLVARYRGQLLAAALTPRARQLILDPVGQVEIRGAVRVETPFNVFADVSAVAMPLVAARMREGAQPVPELEVQPPPPPPQPPRPPRTVIRIRRGPLEGSLPGNAQLVRISFENLSVARVRLEFANATDAQEFDVPTTNDLPLSNRRLAEVRNILLATSDGAEDTGTITLHCDVDGRASRVAVPVVLGSGGRMQTIAFIDADPGDRKGELLAHLQANRGYYTRAIFQRLDSASLVQLLARFAWNGRPLADQIEPTPVCVAGNYIVVRAPARDEDPSGLGEEDWGTALRNRAIDLTHEGDARLVPIPTGGVFAEAVLGRSNSAEKLDITRFWNWQDSPIPLQPPEIAPIAAGSRATEENLVPGQLGAPVLNIMNPTALPDPTSLSAILTAIANGNMFRDMSGLAGTQAAGRALAEGTMTAATEAGRIASANYKVAADQATEMAKTAADMWKVYQSSGGKDGSNKSVSAEGARVNHGRDMDERGVNQPSSSGGGASDGSGEGGAASDVETSAGEGADSSSGSTDRMEGPPNEWTMSRAGAGMPPLDEMTGRATDSTDFVSKVEESFGLTPTTADSGVFRKPKGRTIEVTSEFMDQADQPLEFGQITMSVHVGEWPFYREIWKYGPPPYLEYQDVYADGNEIKSGKLRGVTAKIVVLELRYNPRSPGESGPSTSMIATAEFKLPKDRKLNVVVTATRKHRSFTVTAPNAALARDKALPQLTDRQRKLLDSTVEKRISPGRYKVTCNFFEDLVIKSPEPERVLGGGTP
jgi:hypothetical protein